MSNALTDWLGTSGKNLTEAVKIFHPAAHTDGKVTRYDVFGVDALVVRHECGENTGGDLPTPSVKLTFLLPASPQIAVGDEIEYSGKRYRIRVVQVSRSLTGRIAAQRCQTE